jgi:hypothetical protein
MANQISVQIVGDASKFERELKSAGKSAQGFGSRIGSMMKVAGPLAGAAIAGGIVAGLKSSIGAAKEAEQAQARLQQALGSAGVSYAKHGEAIDSAIQKTSKLAALDDEELSDSFAKLVRTSGDVKQSIEGMALAADIARARNISLESATKVVEKGLIGQETAFKRVGVEITKGMTASEAFAAAQEKFAGAAKAHGETAAGAQEKLGVAFENLQERIGQKLLPVFTSLVLKLTEVVDWVELHWPEIEETFNNGVEKARAIFQKIRPILQNIVDQVKEIAKLIKAVIDGDWSQVWDSIKAIVRNAIENAIDLIKLQFSVWKATFLALAGKALEGMTEGLKALPGLVLDAIKAIPGLIIGYYKFMFNAALGLGEMVVKGLAAGLKGAASAVGGAISDAVRAAINYLIDRVNAALEFKISVPFAPDININAPDIPHLAMGGIVTRPTVALIGERGPEAVVPLRGRGGSAGNTYHFHFPNYVGSKQELIETVQRGLQQYELANGTTGISRRG